MDLGLLTTFEFFKNNIFGARAFSLIETCSRDAADLHDHVPGGAEARHPHPEEHPATRHRVLAQPRQVPVSRRQHRVPGQHDILCQAFSFNTEQLNQADSDGRGKQTASPMLTAIMSGGVGISGRELSTQLINSLEQTNHSYS